jgi:hypothetical protein
LGGPGGLTLATPNGVTVTGALEAVLAAIGVGEGIGVGTVTTAITGNDLPLSFDRQIGESGKYKDVTAEAPYNDNNQAHHMPSKKYLSDHNMDPDEGFSVVIPKEQHYQTRSYGQSKPDISAPYRTEIGKDIADYMNILKKDGLWTPEIRESLMKGLDDFKVEFPDLFKKINQQ